MNPASPAHDNSPANLRAVFWVVAAAIGAALHIGKLPPALPVLERELGISLVQAGFLLSLVQLAGMLLGLATGLAVQRVGLKRSMMAGLLVLGGASGIGAMAESASWLLVTRAVEGLGFLWVVLPGPGMLRRLVPESRINSMLGVWGTYMPMGTSVALLLGPWVMLLGPVQGGWRIWWWLLALVALGFGLLLRLCVPADPPRHPVAAGSSRANASSKLLGLTLRSGPVWLLALTFCMYSGQWLAVIGFLPSIYAKAGIASAAAGWLTGLAAALNMVGNLVAGRLLERGVMPHALLVTGFLAMACGAMLAFGTDIAPRWQFAAVLVFSTVGGLIPATLFSLGVRLAPDPAAVSATVGWMQQWSSAGQFAVPPLVAWVAVHAGGWQWTGWVTVALSTAGLMLASQIGRALKRR